MKSKKILSIVCAFSLVVSSMFCTNLLSASAEENNYDIIYNAANAYVQSALNEATAEELLSAVQSVLPEVTLDTANDYFIKHAVPGVKDDDTSYPLSIPGSDGAVAAIFGYNSQRIGITVGFAHEEETISVSEVAVVGVSDGFTYDSDGNVTAYSGSADKIVFPSGYTGTMTNLADKTSVNNVKVVIINNNVLLKDQSFAGWQSLKAVQFGLENAYIFQANIGTSQFKGCPVLKYVQLPKSHGRDGYAWWTITTTSVFENCVKLENLILPYNSEGTNLSQGYRAFYNTAVRDFFLNEYMIISNESYDGYAFSKGTRNVITYDTDMTFVRAAALAQAAVSEKMRADCFSTSSDIETVALNAVTGSHDADTFKNSLSLQSGEWSDTGADLGGLITFGNGTDTVTLNCITKNQNDVLTQKVQSAFTEYVVANKNDSTAAGLLAAVKAVNSTATLADENFAIYYAQPSASDNDTASGYQLNIPGNDGAVAAKLTVAGFEISCAAAFEQDREIISSENVAIAGANDGKLNYDSDGNIIGCAEGVDKIIIPSEFNGTFASNGDFSLATVETVIIRNTVAIIRDAFSGSDGRWNSLKALDINADCDYHYSGVSFMTQANVNGISKLKYVALPRCLDNTWIDNNSFYNLPSLVTVNVPVYCSFNYECFYNTGVREFILSAKCGDRWFSANVLHERNLSGGKTVSTVNADTAITDVRAAAWIAAAVSENSTLDDNSAISAAKTALLSRAWNEAAQNYFEVSSVSFESGWNTGDNGVDTCNIIITNGASVFNAQLTKVRVVPEIAMNGSVEMCTEHGYGLNFGFTVSGLDKLTATGASFTLNTMIVPVDYLEETEFTPDALTNAGLDFINIPITVYESDGSNLTANAAITNIKAENFNREFVARAYIDITYKDGAAIRVYADYSKERDAESAYNMAIRLLNDSESPVSDSALKSVLQNYVDRTESNKETVMYVDYNADSKEFGVVQNYSASENMVMRIKPTGVNNILNIAPPKFIANTDSALSSDISSAYDRAGAEDTSESDWLGPHYIDYSWIGGTHGTDGEGGNPTGFTDNIQIKLDGKTADASQNINSYATTLTITWDSYAGAVTKAESVVVEHHTLRFDGKTWHVQTELEFNKACIWNRYYGIQAVFGPYSGEISYDGEEWVALGNTSSNKTDTQNMLLRKNSDYLNLYLDTGYGLGKRELYRGTDSAFTASYNAIKNAKAYFNLVSDAAMKAGDKVGLMGSYTFYSSKALDTDAYNRSVVNEGNAAKIAKAMKKAQNGEPVTVGVIGGSITQGYHASDRNKTSYASLLKAWWEKSFPDSELTFINAGKGDTTSLMGVYRATEDLLKYEPDFVVVEFSVNDQNEDIYQKSYEGLVRQILNSSKKPGVLLLQTMNNAGENRADIHTPVGEYYNLPIISYKEALWPTGGNNMFDWGEISPDNIHPNDLGHSIIARLVTNYLSDVKDNVNAYSDIGSELKEAAFSGDFDAAARYNHDNFTPSSLGAFVPNDNTYQFGAGWTATGSGDAMTFSVKNAKYVYIMYYQDASGSDSRAEVNCNGVSKGTMSAYQGWARSEAFEVVNSDTAGDYTITIKPTSADGKQFSVLGILVS